MKIIDGKLLSKKIINQLKLQVDELKSKNQKIPHLAVILIGNNPASQSYVKAKITAAQKAGFLHTIIQHDELISQSELITIINKLNQDDQIDGFIVQLPLPKHINEQQIIESINPKKDIDGFHPQNLGKMMLNIKCFQPATPSGIIKLLQEYNINTEGKHCVILGRSHIVGTPMSILLSRNSNPGNCTVTLCHSKTQSIEKWTKMADIIILAIGKPNFLKKEMIKEGATIIDVGINRIQNETGYKIVGDADFHDIFEKCSHITPVPGGVGPMTIASLLQNTLDACKGNC